MYQKNFEDWHNLKPKINSKSDYPLFNEREIWWCSIGVNIGDEEDGKGRDFTRPVLIIRKFNKRIFIGIPLTTKIKDNPFYHKFTFRDKPACLLMSQIKVIDSKRLLEKMERLPKGVFNKIKEDFVRNVIKFPGS